MPGAAFPLLSNLPAADLAFAAGPQGVDDSDGLSLAVTLTKIRGVIPIELLIVYLNPR